MCGIAGIVDHQGSTASAIVSMTNALKHRGPDAQNVFTDSKAGVALGHTRLSIIDLSEAANQPFSSSNGRYVTVFNGEIYNFSSLRKQLRDQHDIAFKTSSDTEVLVEGFAIWGSDLVSKLEGMFAFAILDRESEKLFLFRDRVGKKPLFYMASDDCFVFASEIKSLLAHPAVASAARLRNQSIPSFLHLGYIPEPHTIYENILKFPAGCMGELERGSLSIRPYWSLEENISGTRIVKETYAKDHLQQLLSLAVGDRLVSDVPIGAFLSGGTDSSLICATASRLMTGRLKTFSIGFKDSKFDESRYAKEVSSCLNTDHEEFILEEREAMDILDAYLHHFDEPFADTSAIPTMLVSKLARRQVKVALTGDGGDELFQGYGAYRWAERLDSPVFRVLRSPVRAILNSTGQNRALRVGHLLENVSDDRLRSHIFSQEQYFFSQTEIDQLLPPYLKPIDQFNYQDTPRLQSALSSAERQALFDFKYYLRDDLLVKVDRASMYYALECRCPLLDHRIIEFAFSLSQRLKVRKGVSKWILKELLRDYLPERLIHRQKWGFSVPLARWMKGELKYMIEDNINERSLSDLGLFNVEYALQLKKDFLNGKNYLFNRLWVIAVLQSWLKEHGINVNA